MDDSVLPVQLQEEYLELENYLLFAYVILQSFHFIYEKSLIITVIPFDDYFWGHADSNINNSQKNMTKT